MHGNRRLLRSATGLADRQQDRLGPGTDAFRNTGIDLEHAPYLVWRHSTVKNQGRLAADLACGYLYVLLLERVDDDAVLGLPAGRLADRLPRVREPYAWQVRVPDLPKFLQHIAPVLERRLAESLAVGHTGELKISTYRGGVRLVFEQGRLRDIGPWQPSLEVEGDAAFPDGVFLQLLFGFRSLAELTAAFRDCWTAGDEAEVLLKALFPKRPSYIWEIG